MKYRQNCVIVVPVYRETPDELERLSLKQLDKVINNDHDIVFVRPKNGIDIKSYFDLITKTEVTSIAFDDKYFKNTMTYSQLCLSYEFYKCFERYNYMMIYQTDCWIFKNEIDKFCDMGYDYIGPPIYSKYSFWPSFKIGSRPMVGNGGLSLRKISKMLQITDPNGYIYNKFGKEQYEKFDVEDVVICDLFAHMIYMNIPDYKVAEKFGFDFFPENKNAEELIKSTNPMACHRVFMLFNAWKTFIPEINDNHISELCQIEYNKWKESFSKKVGISYEDTIQQ